MYWIYDLHPLLAGSLIVSVFVVLSTFLLVLVRPWLYHHLRLSAETNESTNGIFAGTGVLLGILLGLVAVAAWQSYDDGNEKIIQEASEVATLFRDVSTLKEPVKLQLQHDLTDYLNHVVNLDWPEHRQGRLGQGAGLILSSFLGKLTAYHAETPEQQIFLAEIFSSYNKLIEARRARLAIVDSGLPAVFWVVMLVGSSLSILMTYLFHISDIKTHLVLTGIYSAFLGFMIALIAMVDNPLRGDMAVQPDPYTAVLNSLHELEAVKKPLMNNGR